MINGEAITNATRVKAGDKVTYQIVVTNTGKVTLHNVVATDNLVSSFNKIIENLAPGASKTYTVEYEVTQNDVDTKATIVNTATATDGTTTGTDTDETIPTDKTPGIEVEKTAVSVTPNGTTTAIPVTDTTKVRAGDVITYTITVTNTGKITLKDIQVMDKTLNVNYNGAEITAGETIDTIESLAPGISETYTVTYTVTASDIDNKDQIDNIATATDGTTTDEKPANPVPVNPNVTISGTKTWNDANNQDGKRPETITVNVIANGNETPVASKEVRAGDNWTYTFTELPKYEDGEEITYSVTENEVSGYTTIIDGYNITNAHTPETTSISGAKTWVGDSDGNRPASITVKVMNGSKSVASKTVTANDNWKYEFTGLPKYANGTEINYTIAEVKVSGYETTINGYDITNTYIKQVTINKKEYPVKAIDVVLVLDVSSSMKDHSRIANAQKAACNFIDGMFPAGTNGTGSTVTVVTFGNDAKTLGKATNATDAKTLKTKVNGVTIPDGVGTNVQAALAHTNTVLDGLNNTNKFVVFLGDGAPTPSYIIVHGGYVWNDRKHDWEWTENYEAYNQSNFPNNTETNIKKEANTLKGKTTGVYTIGFGMDKLLDSREYWSHYTECGVANCKDPNHIIVNAGDVNRGKSYHWESAKSYATRILSDIIADKATTGKQYYYTADDSADSIVKQFMDVLKSISTTTTTINTAKQTVKIEVTGGTVNTTQDIIITINGTEYKCKISELPKYGVSYTKTSSEEYFTWDVSGYTTESLEIEYTIK